MNYFCYTNRENVYCTEKRGFRSAFFSLCRVHGAKDVCGARFWCTVVVFVFATASNAKVKEAIGLLFLLSFTLREFFLLLEWDEAIENILR